MWEEFGYTIAESIAAGLPVIAYDCPYGPREILDGGRYGILVKTEDEMAEAMKELLENISFWRELSQRSFLRARDFDIKKISEKYREAFKKILG
jgi:glycosyltransferase involved in cell wall biosynthesis